MEMFPDVAATVLHNLFLLPLILVLKLFCFVFLNSSVETRNELGYEKTNNLVSDQV